jgi:DHA1 family tetracycline resistance protein-like MFS transporter
LHAPFFVAAGLSAANALFGLIVLKESLPPERRRRFEWWRANPLGSLKALARFPQLLLLIAVLVLAQFAHDCLPSTWSYYTMLKFGWGPGEIAWSLVAVGALMALSFAVLPAFLVPRIGETKAVILGFVCAVAAYAGYAFAAKGWIFYAWMIPFTLGGVGGPALNAIMSHQVPATEQGELQGAASSLTSLTSVVAMWAMPTLFAWFTGPSAPVYFPGAAFFAAALCEACGLILFVLSRQGARKARGGQ